MLFVAWSRARTEVIQSPFPKRITQSLTTFVAAGAQWFAFRDGTGTHDKRTCQGAMDQDDTDYKFKIEMNLDNANLE
jgi:hypothetical protein